MFGQSLLSAFGSAACTTDTDQLFTTDVQTTSVATYQLNNATTSIPSNTYPGTASNITYAAGKFGNAAVFNGSSSTFFLASAGTSVTNYDSDFSVSMWFNVSSWASAASSDFLWTGGGTRIVNLGLTGSYGLAFDLWNSGSNIVSTTGLSENIWYNVVITRSKTAGMVLYINGASVDTNSFTGNAGSLASQDSIGTYWNNTRNNFTGKIDQVRIFNTALPQAAVTALYNETTTTATYPYVDYEVANPNSVAYYKMSDATDQLGNYNGTASNVNFNTEGKFGFAGAFNGTSSRINLSNNPINGLSSVSFSFWIKPLDISSYQYVLSLINAVGGWNGLGVRISNTGKIQVVRANSGAVTTSENSTTSLSLNVWQHIAVTVQQSGTVIYINGSEDGTFSNTPFTTNNTGSFDIGMNEYNPGVTQAWTNGSIDQLRIYDSALSAANVTTLYNEIECPAVAVTNAFNTVLYTGNSSTNPITGVGFQPDLTWIKQRNSGARNHNLTDSVRGASSNLFSDSTYYATTNNQGFGSFDSDGFTLNNTGSGGGGGNTNILNINHVAWNWKAGGTAVSNTEGTTTSQVSANTNAGFSIVSYSGTGANATVGHGLSSAPQLILQKRYEAAANWFVYSQAIGNTKYINLDATGAAGSAVNVWNNTDPTDKVFSVSSFFDVNGSGISSIAYCFTSIPGYSKVGSYSGGSSGSSNVIVIGFKPRFLIVKRTDQAGDAWQMFDSTMAGADTFDDYLQANTSAAEASYNQREVNFTNNGFYWTYAESGTNISGGNYIFLAIA